MFLPGRFRFTIRLTTLVAAMLATSAAAEERQPVGPAIAIAVRLPITGTRDTEVEAAILRQLDRLRGRPQERGVLVLQFDVTDDDGPLASDFGRSLELARFLSDGRLAGVKTVAFLPEGAKGHAVLVALACEEIVMAADAVLGPANADEPNVDDAMRAAYMQVAARRKTVPPALALAPTLDHPASAAVAAAGVRGRQAIRSSGGFSGLSASPGRSPGAGASGGPAGGGICGGGIGGAFSIIAAMSSRSIAL
jgi:hypothetical protein